MMKTKSLNVSLLGGHIVECFDNTLYGFFAVLLAPLYFPADEPGIATLNSFLTFAAGYLVRPVGAIIFGRLGDREGRRKPLLYTMMLIGIPTMMLGFIPRYDQIGIIAPACLVACRLLQGIFWGGEFTGVNLFISESYDKKVHGRKTGVLISAGVYGAALAAFVGAFCTMEIMPNWAWRIPFVFGGLSAIGIYLLRRRLYETEEFKYAKSHNELVKTPWKYIFWRYQKQFFLAYLISGLTLIPLYNATILGNQFFKTLGYTASQSMVLNGFAMLFDGICIYIFGKLADKIGFHRQMLWGSFFTAIVAFPAYWLVTDNHSTLNVFLFIGLLVFSGCIINGCAMPYIARFFPTNIRYSALAMSVTTGHALIGGLTPYTGSKLSYMFGPSAPAYWIVLVSTVTAFCIWFSNGFQTKTKNNNNSVSFTNKLDFLNREKIVFSSH